MWQLAQLQHFHLCPSFCRLSRTASSSDLYQNVSSESARIFEKYCRQLCQDDQKMQSSLDVIWCFDYDKWEKYCGGVHHSHLASGNCRHKNLGREGHRHLHIEMNYMCTKCACHQLLQHLVDIFYCFSYRRTSSRLVRKGGITRGRISYI